MDISGSRTLPFTLGHEIVGTVQATGPEASDVRVGEIYVAFPWIGCGECDLCAAGAEHHCLQSRALGTHVDGGFSDHVLVPHPRYLFDIGSIDPTLACTYACSGLAAYSAIRRLGTDVRRNLVLIGMGGVGFAGLSIARALLDVEVTVVDLDPAKLEQAKEVGATHVIDARATDVAKQIKRATRGGAEAVVDFVGSEESATLGVRALAKRGVLVVVGLFGGAVTVPLPLFSLKHISILGSALGSLEEMGELMDLARSGAVAPIPVAVRPMSTVQHALEDLQQGRVMGRVVLTQQMETTA
jgi:D-arabinose 1-dehydrogenase-like Zn-dependent alcohol dehydrogenase